MAICENSYSVPGEVHASGGSAASRRIDYTFLGSRLFKDERPEHLWAPLLVFLFERVPFPSYQLRSNGKPIEVSAILAGGISFVGRQYGSIPEGYRNLHRLFIPSLSTDSLEFLTMWILALKVNMEPRDNIKDIMKRHPSIQLPKGLDSEAAAEVLFQIGIFLDQTEGSLETPSKRDLYPTEKFPDAKHTQDLIAMTVAAARYSRLLAQGLFALDTPEDYIALVNETDSFFTECSYDLNLDRSRLFQRLTQRSHIYLHMC